MKIKEQTRKLAAGCSKHCFEVVDKTDEVSSKHCFEVVDRTDEVSNHTYTKATLTWFEEIFEEYDFSNFIISPISPQISPVPRKTKSVPKRSLEPKKKFQSKCLGTPIYTQQSFLSYQESLVDNIHQGAYYGSIRFVVSKSYLYIMKPIFV